VNGKESESSSPTQFDAKSVTFVSAEDNLDDSALNIDDSSPASPEEALNTIGGWYFDDIDESTMIKFKKSELVDMCVARGIETDGLSKQSLVDALFHWVIVDYFKLTLEKTRFASWCTRAI
jgi:hypothetical protein